MTLNIPWLVGASLQSPSPSSHGLLSMSVPLLFSSEDLPLDVRSPSIQEELILRSLITLARTLFSEPGHIHRFWADTVDISFGTTIQPTTGTTCEMSEKGALLHHPSLTSTHFLPAPQLNEWHSASFFLPFPAPAPKSTVKLSHSWGICLQELIQ